MIEETYETLNLGKKAIDRRSQISSKLMKFNTIEKNEKKREGGKSRIKEKEGGGNKNGVKENGISRGIDIAVGCSPECNLIEDREKLLPADVQPRRVVDTSCYQDYTIASTLSSSWLHVPIMPRTDTERLHAASFKPSFHSRRRLPPPPQESFNQFQKKRK